MILGTSSTFIAAMLSFSLIKTSRSQWFISGQADGKSYLTNRVVVKVSCSYDFWQRITSSGAYVNDNISALRCVRNSSVSVLGIDWGLNLACFTFRWAYMSRLSEFFMKTMVRYYNC